MKKEKEESENERERVVKRESDVVKRNDYGGYLY